jgi:cation diffusion facilitator CzcD-associated flavoprotein CzcO
MEAAKHYDVLIIGAGISGVSMACHLMRECPGKTFAILERRSAIGGTWDLFRYPGIRSDSDMMSFGFGFRPWTDNRILADGPAIRDYVNATAKEWGVDRKVQFGLRTVSANWSSTENRWIVDTLSESGSEARTFTCDFLVSATGYYNHDEGYLPTFPGVESFKGQCIHPQHWPEQLDYRGKRVVVIGSGATAVTLIPAMANETAHITMLQRSPSYVYSLPAIDKLSIAMRRFLPESLVYAIARKRNIVFQRTTFKFSRRFPRLARWFLLAAVRKQLGADFDMKHFTPKYMPWDERLCAVPNGDLFKVLRERKASVVTDHIECFTENGILLKSGRTLKADIIVTATGLKLQSLGGIKLSIDGQEQNISERMTYKGVLLQDLPNFGYLFGYTNISWTLKVDMAAEFICRVLRERDRRGATVVTPRAPGGEILEESVLASLQAGYVQRSESMLPRQGRALPWRVLHHFERDREMYRKQVDDAALEWSEAV